MFDLSAFLKKLSSNHTAEKKLIQFLERLGKTTSLLQDAFGPEGDQALRHLENAEKSHLVAVDFVKEGDLLASNQRLDRGLLHLSLADLIVSSASSSTDEIDALFSALPLSEAERGAQDLVSAVADIKLAVEYHRLAVAGSTKQDLKEAVKILEETLKELLKGDEDAARRMAEASLVLLYVVVHQINLDNKRHLLELRQSGAPHSKLTKRARETADKIYALRSRIEQEGLENHEQIVFHIKQAEGHYRSLVRELCEDNDSADTLISAASAEIRLAERLIKTVGPNNLGFPGHEAEVSPDLDEQLKETVFHMKKLLTDHAKRGKYAAARLESATTYFLDARHQAEQEKWKEADRSIHSALLDLDFAKQLVFSGEADL